MQQPNFNATSFAMDIVCFRAQGRILPSFVSASFLLLFFFFTDKQMSTQNTCKCAQKHGARDASAHKAFVHSSSALSPGERD